MDVDLHAVHESVAKLQGTAVKTVREAKSGAIVIEMDKPLDKKARQAVQHAVNSAAFEGRDVTKPLVRPTYSSLKFDFVPLRFGDGSPIPDGDVEAFVRAHPKWANLTFVEPIKRIENKRVPGVFTLLCKVADDDKGSIAKELLRTLVRFGPEVRRC